MPKIAVIKMDNLGYYDDEHHQILRSISEWVDISDKDLDILQKYRPYGYYIIEQVPPKPTAETAISVETLLKNAKQKYEQQVAREKKAEEQARQRRAKRAQTELARKKALLEKLKKELNADGE